MVLQPKRTYSARRNSATASYDSTGSMHIFANPSLREKDVDNHSLFADTTFDADSYASMLREAQQSVIGGSTNISGFMEDYMNSVNEASTSAKNATSLDILRSTPDTFYTIDTAKKLLMVDNLASYYRVQRPGYQMAYTNYNSFHVPDGFQSTCSVAWLYPNITDNNRPKGCYSPTSSFSLGVHLNPRYSTSAGTLLHLSSSLALSIVTGSAIGLDGNPSGFRLLLQLSSSADVHPSVVTPGVGAGSYAYLSDDNSLSRNSWHHVLITWDPQSNNSTGTFYVDGENRGNFYYPSSSVSSMPTITAPAPGVLSVGNYYAGTNTSTNAQIRFFSADTALREGVYELDPTTGVDYPTAYAFNSQFVGEFHDLSLSERYIHAEAVKNHEGFHPSQSLFYVPPYFVPGAPLLKEVNGKGGLLTSPFAALDEASECPFSAPMSFGVAGFYPSLENFTLDFATNHYARVLNLTASQITISTVGAMSANDYLYSTSSVFLRSVNILPCDDGLFRTDFSLLQEKDSVSKPRFVDDLGVSDLSLISLRDMVENVNYNSFFRDESAGQSELAKELAGSTPERMLPTSIPSELYSVYQRTLDATSNEVVIFEISNLFYGERIKPGTFKITDPRWMFPSASLSVSLSDDGHGVLYRSDAVTKNASWSNIGNIFYEEGLVILKTPSLPFFGKYGFDLQFSGEKTTNVIKISVPLESMSNCISQNTTWNKDLETPAYVNRDEDKKYVAVSNVNFHDKNLNVVMRAQLAQPLVKRFGSRYMIYARYDF